MGVAEVRSGLTKHQIDHPTTSDVWPFRTAVVKDVGVVAACVLECVGQDWQPIEGALGVNASCKGNDGRREPRRIGDEGAEWVAKDVTNYANFQL